MIKVNPGIRQRSESWRSQRRNVGRKSKPNVEHTLAQNLKSDSKSFYEYVSSKQNARDKVGPLEYNAGNYTL